MHRFYTQLRSLHAARLLWLHWHPAIAEVFVEIRNDTNACLWREMNRRAEVAQ